MATQSATLLTAFNDHFMEFVNDIVNVFPGDTDLATAKNSFTLIRKANPKMIVKIWQKFVVEKYSDVIDTDDISFFLNKDYSADLSNAENSDKIMEAINRLRTPVQMMTPEDQEKVMKYMQNLKKLSVLYHSMA
jgi:hypothetical protein